METKKTPFYENHILNKAKMVDFAGFKMPIQYAGIVPEHRKVRKKVGLFDVSHMGEFVVKGPGAFDFIQKMTTNDVSKLQPYRIQYSSMCYDDGGIVDDLLVYRFPDHYMMVVNASNLNKDFQWLESHKPSSGVDLINRSDEIGLLALQGPKAQSLLRKLTPANLDDLNYYWCLENEVAGEKMIISRTGYTGEDGFELYMPGEIGPKIWGAIMEAGVDYEIEPIGLGARDTLRLEMCYALYGNDIDQSTHPFEANMGWIVKLEKGNFTGREALIDKKTAGIKRKLVAFELKERGFPRQHYKIFHNGNEVGEVTSGTFSPSLNKGIGMGYVPKELSSIDNPIQIQIRDNLLEAVIVAPPFWKKSSHK
ncbi:glycine cleavage system aminomethyltransferase GcvT [bacterium]|nr:glycine cleavage system aminomethyltransferase GcvT [bacterium]